METPLDRAHGAMQNDDSAAPGFYACLLGVELFLLLEEEAGEGRAKPLVLETSDGPLVLAFDLEERLAGFSDDSGAAYLALSGRRLAQMLAGQGLGLGLNLGQAPSAMVLPPEAVDWLAGAAERADEKLEAKPAEISPPAALPEALLQGLDGRLANMSGVVAAAYLVAVRYENGAAGHMLALVDVPAAAKDGVAEALAETLRLCGEGAGPLDLAFLSRDDPGLEAFRRAGLGFDIPPLVLSTPPAPQPPGSDPDTPPILR